MGLLDGFLGLFGKGRTYAHCTKDPRDGNYYCPQCKRTWAEVAGILGLPADTHVVDLKTILAARLIEAANCEPDCPVLGK